MKTKKIDIFNKPLISVIVNCHNGERYLKKSIKSIISQSYKNWEIIFFDNKSTDNSKKIIKEFKDHRIYYFRSNKFLNLYRARNLAVEKAKGKYLCFLDADDYWTKDKLKKQINFILNNREYKIVYSNYFCKIEKKKIFFQKYKTGVLPKGYITKKLLKDYYVGILTIMVDRDVFDCYKFKNFYNIIGDFDFIIRASLKFKIGCIQQPLAYYRIHSSNYSKKKMDLQINELKHWILKNEKVMKKFSISIDALKKRIFKLTFKNYLKFFGRVVQW